MAPLTKEDKMMYRRWGAGGTKKAIYKYSDKEHKHRMGSCDWLPKDGDLCICVGHSGDCFSDYVAMRKTAKGTYEMVGKFGAYNFGKPVGELSDRDYHLLQAGEEIEGP